MQPHPDFATADLPRSAQLGAFKLTPLTGAEVDEDYAVVMASAAVLKDVFGNWPNGLSLADNLTDLHWHDREFTQKRSFSWIIRDGSGTYLGCAYIFPTLGERGLADGVAWLRDTPNRDALAAALFEPLMQWVRSAVPDTVSLSWTFSPQIERVSG